MNILTTKLFCYYLPLSIVGFYYTVTSLFLNTYYLHISNAFWGDAILLNFRSWSNFFDRPNQVLEKPNTCELNSMRFPGF